VSPHIVFSLYMYSKCFSSLKDTIHVGFVSHPYDFS
jgi:hypothetical protein